MPTDPFAEFDTFLRNSRAQATFCLTHGYVHAEAHHLIVARLTPWIECVTAAGAEIRDKLRALALAEQEAS